MRQVDSPEDLGFSRDRLERAYGLVAEWVECGAIPGAAVAIARQGAMLPVRTFGRAGAGEGFPPVQPDTIFLIASISKPITATGFMLLVEEGRVALDQPVAQILPEFSGRGKGEVLVRHLLTHTSGLPDMLPENLELRAKHAPLSEFLERIHQVELAFPPGTKVSYQSTGFALLAEMVERIEGMPFRDFLRERLFLPLGMEDTHLGAPSEGRERIARVALPDWQVEEDNWNWNSDYWWNFGAPWGGVFSTAEDLAHFCQLFLDEGWHGGEAILSPATVSAMTSDQVAWMPQVPEAVKLANRWGLGWHLGAYGALTSPETFGHGGATGTMVWADPWQELVCVLLTNQPAISQWHCRELFSNAVAAAVLLE